MGIAKKHLSEAERKEIASGLFKIKSTEEKKGELHGLCPIHQESNPSFSYNFKKDFYNCFSCGASGDLLKLWCEVNGYGQKDGFKAFCEKFGIPLGGNRKQRGAAAKGAGREEADMVNHEKAVEQMHRAWELFTPLPDAWIARLENTRGWARKWIEISDLRLETYRMKKNGELIKLKNPEKIVIPIRDVQGNLVNIRLYHEGAKQYKIISFARSTGSSRLFPPKPFNDLIDAEGNHKRPILLCEGESDTICALSHGFNAITQTSKLKNWPEEHLRPFKGRDVIIAYDADELGQKYARYAAQALTGVAQSIRMIRWPSFMGIDESGAIPANHGQDLTDFFVRHGKTAEDFQELIDEAQSYDAGPSIDTSPDTPDAPDPSAFFAHGINQRYSFKPRLLAEKIAADYKLMSDPETGLLYSWNGKFWDIFDENYIKAAAIEYLGRESQKSRIEDAVYQVKAMATLPHGRKVNDQFDWICLQNGMFNFMTFEIRDHDPDFYCTHALPVSFNPDSKDYCERFMRYLEETIQTPEPIAQAQEFAGYCLTRHARYEKCLFLYGPGSDGKSTFMKVMKELVGSENCAAVSFAGLENEFHRSSLYNKLLNISTEVGGQAIESPYFKAITSGDPIDAAFKHQNSFTFTPYCKMIFAGNIMPRVKDNSDGFFRKLLPIQFKRQFKEDDPDRDPELLDKLKKELSEIFYFALCGLKRLTEQRRFTDCDETRKLLMGYRRTNNPVLCYVEDECIIGDEYDVAKADIYADYRKYCSDNRFMAVNRENFFRELYSAVSHLRLYRARIEGGRENRIKGLRFGGLQMIDTLLFLSCFPRSPLQLRRQTKKRNTAPGGQGGQSKFSLIAHETIYFYYFYKHNFLMFKFEFVRNSFDHLDHL